MENEFNNEILNILKEYLRDIDITTPKIAFQIDNLKYYLTNKEGCNISDIIYPLKVIFQSYNCNTNFIKCLKSIYVLHFKYSNLISSPCQRIFPLHFI